MTADHPSTETPVIVPTPVAIHTYSRESKIVLATKFLSWLTAFLLAIAVVISLISVVSERNNLSEEAQCRSAANGAVNKAITEVLIDLGSHNVLSGEFFSMVISGDREDPEFLPQLKEVGDKIEAAGVELDGSAAVLRQAIENQEKALLSCSQG